MKLGMELRDARQAKGWTQQEAARRLSVSQGYLSLLENGRRSPSPAKARKLAQLYQLPPTAVPLMAAAPVPAHVDDLVVQFAALGYPGFQHVRRNVRVKNPAELVLEALQHERLEPRVAGALPWVLGRYPDLNWEWLLRHAKVLDLQNRLGFVVTLARKLAERNKEFVTAATLADVERLLERSRLAREDVFGRSALTEAETRWLRTHRPEEATHWNLLSNLTVEHL